MPQLRQEGPAKSRQFGLQSLPIRPGGPQYNDPRDPRHTPNMGKLSKKLYKSFTTILGGIYFSIFLEGTVGKMVQFALHPAL